MTMIWYNLAFSLSLLGLAGFLAHRLVRQWHLEAIASKDPTNKKLQKKVAIIQQRETAAHLRAIFSWGIGLILGLFFLLYALFQVENQVTQLGEEVTRMKDELQVSKKEQAYYFQGVELKEYPAEGLHFSTEPWKKLLQTKGSRTLKGEMEQHLAQSLTPYLGLTTAILTTDTTKNTVTLALKSDARENNSQHERTILENLMKELEGVPTLSQVSYELMTNKDKQAASLMILVYERTGDGMFQLIKDSATERGED